MRNFLKGTIEGRSKKGLVVFSVLLVAIFLFLPFNHASAIDLSLGGILGDVSSVMFTAISFFLRKLVWPCVAFFVRFGAWAVDVFLDPALYRTVLMTDPATGNGGQAIDAGWRTVRDFCNMFYIFFLLLVAFSTITRSQAYSAKNILPKIILSIFFINFSKVITELAIDCGQVFLFGIAGWMGSFSGPTGKGAGLTMVVDLLRSQFEGTDNSSGATLIILISSIIYTFMLGLAYIMLAGFLLFRLVTFVFLIIVSPFAFFGLSLPSMKKYWNQWLSQLISNVFSGPVLIFFIYISAIMALDVATYQPTVETNSLGFAKSTIFYIIRGLIPLGMMYFAIPASQKLGGYGSKQLIGGAYGFGTVAMGTYAGAKLASKPVKYVGGGMVHRAGIDSDKVRKNALEGANYVGDKLSGSGNRILKATGSVIKGKVVLEESKQMKDKNAKLKQAGELAAQMKGEGAVTVARGIEASKPLGWGTLTPENKIKIAALMTRAAEDGINIMDKKNFSTEQLEAALDGGIDLKNLSKYDPYAAGALKAMKEGGNVENHEKEYFEKLVASGGVRGLTKQYRENHFGTFVSTLGADQLKSVVARSNPITRREYTKGADEWLGHEGVKAADTGNLTQYKAAQALARDVIKDYEVTEAERDFTRAGEGKRKDNAGALIEFGGTSAAGVNINAVNVEKATRDLIPSAKEFGSLTQASKVLYVTHLKDTGKLSKLSLKQERPETLQQMADALKRRKAAYPADPVTSAIYAEAKAKDELARYGL